jgi:hypothetical protein
VLTRTNSGSGSNNKDRTGNPLAQLGYLPDHLESAIQNEVRGVETFRELCRTANISKRQCIHGRCLRSSRAPKGCIAIACRMQSWRCLSTLGALSYHRQGEVTCTRMSRLWLVADRIPRRWVLGKTTCVVTAKAEPTI